MMAVPNARGAEKHLLKLRKSTTKLKPRGTSRYCPRSLQNLKSLFFFFLSSVVIQPLQLKYFCTVTLHRGSAFKVGGGTKNWSLTWLSLYNNTFLRNSELFHFFTYSNSFRTPIPQREGEKHRMSAFFQTFGSRRIKNFIIFLRVYFEKERRIFFGAASVV